MKIARIKHKGSEWIGSVNTVESKIHLIKEQCDTAPDAMIEVIESSLDSIPPASTLANVSFDEVTFLPPVARPSKNIICVGKNYTAHAAEFTKSGYDSSASNADDIIPDAPILFSKAACTMIGAKEDIVVPWDISEKIDYEAELGLIIGRTGRSISKEDAYDHVWGYTVINDMTARDLQSTHKQWLLGKSIDTFCPIGPWVTTADELDPENLELSCWVNDELRQHTNTSDLIFDIPNIISIASASMTLSPGDIIATGTPAGVGIGFNPPKFLKKGDVVKVSISDIGTIENTII